MSSFKVGDLVKVYGGCSLHNKDQIFSNGEIMLILEITPEHGANWVYCEFDNRNENEITQYWFLAEQLRSVND